MSQCTLQAVKYIKQSYNKCVLSGTSVKNIAHLRWRQPERLFRCVEDVPVYPSWVQVWLTCSHRTGLSVTPAAWCSLERLAEKVAVRLEGLFWLWTGSSVEVLFYGWKRWMAELQTVTQSITTNQTIHPLWISSVWHNSAPGSPRCVASVANMESDMCDISADPPISSYTRPNLPN